MKRQRAEMVHVFSSEVLSSDWTPTISQEEMDEANERLEQAFVQYRWRWLGHACNLCGSVTLHAEAHTLNVAA